jgi:hypothetical protein
MLDTIPCPHCGKKLRAPDGPAPGRWKCPACGRTFGAEPEPPAEEALGPAEGVYGVAREQAAPRKRPARVCELCGAALRPNASLCDLCGAPLDEEDLPDTPEKRARQERRAEWQAEDEKYRRLDLIVAQVGCALLAALFLGCGYLHVGALLAVGITVVLGGWVIYYRKGPPESASPALCKRWPRETKGVVIQFAVSLAITAALLVFVAFALVRAAGK